MNPGPRVPGTALSRADSRAVALSKPIGVSEYELTRALPRSLQSSLPTIKAIEAELADPPPTLPTPPAPKRLTGPKRKKGRS